MSCLSVLTCISIPVRSKCPHKVRMIAKILQNEDNLTVHIFSIDSYFLGLWLRFRLKIKTRIRFICRSRE